MPCYLRFSGTRFDVDAFVRQCGILPDSLSHQGDASSTHLYPCCDTRSMCRFAVSEADFTDFKTQVTDAIRFLHEHGAALSCWKNFEVDFEPTLDFGVQTRMFDVAFTQVDIFPAELVKLAGKLSVGIEFSQYLPTE
jgi:hypothetical protein